MGGYIKLGEMRGIVYLGNRQIFVPGKFPFPWGLGILSADLKSIDLLAAEKKMKKYLATYNVAVVTIIIIVLVIKITLAS